MCLYLYSSYLAASSACHVRSCHTAIGHRPRTLQVHRSSLRMVQFTATDVTSNPTPRSEGGLAALRNSASFHKRNSACIGLCSYVPSYTPERYRVMAVSPRCCRREKPKQGPIGSLQSCSVGLRQEKGFSLEWFGNILGGCGCHHWIHGLIGDLTGDLIEVCDRGSNVNRGGHSPNTPNSPRLHVVDRFRSMVSGFRKCSRGFCDGTLKPSQRRVRESLIEPAGNALKTHLFAV